MTDRPAMTRRDLLKTCSAVVATAALGGGLNRVIAAIPQTQPATVRRSRPYVLGADISWLLEDESQGATYWDRGTQGDLLEILRRYGFNYIRARLFVDPHTRGGYSGRRSEAFCDLEHTIRLARRAKAAGMGFLLSCHYSDTWASPAHQAKPTAWANLPFNALVDRVHTWTTEVLTQMAANGVAPEMVSIGNETSGGMLFPDGRASDFDRFARLVDAGCTAVRTVNPGALVALHNHLGRDNAFNRKWVDSFLARDTHFDVIGMSCYAQAHEGDWERNFADLSTRYPHLWFAALEYSYRKRYLNDLIYNSPRGLGSFIWEPTRWREAIFDRRGMNAGDDMNNKPHLPASTLPPLSDPNQPTYHPADGATTSSNADDDVQQQIQARQAAASRPATTAAGPRTRGGRYDTNSYMLAYPAMARAYTSQ